MTKADHVDASKTAARLNDKLAELAKKHQWDPKHWKHTIRVARSSGGQIEDGCGCGCS
jgi:hypothetical protein